MEETTPVVALFEYRDGTVKEIWGERRIAYEISENRNEILNVLDVTPNVVDHLDKWNDDYTEMGDLDR